MSLIISDTLSVASTAVSTTLSISLNLPCTSTKLLSKVDSLGNCFSISIQMQKTITRPAALRQRASLVLLYPTHSVDYAADLASAPA